MLNIVKNNIKKSLNYQPENGFKSVNLLDFSGKICYNSEVYDVNVGTFATFIKIYKYSAFLYDYSI